MKLYTFPPSPNGRKVDAVVRHLGIGSELEVELINLGEGAHRRPEYLAINPMGKVPALVDGDLSLWESNAIAMYVAERKGDTSFYPSDPKKRADIARWLFWESSTWAPAVAGIVYENLIKKFFGGGEPDPAKVKEGEEKFHKAAPVLEAQLKGRKFVTGDDLTLADFGLGALLTYAAPGRVPLGDYTNIQAWWGRLSEIDAWKASAPRLPGS
jgi:glutathione S-transferase